MLPRLQTFQASLHRHTRISLETLFQSKFQTSDFGVLLSAHPYGIWRKSEARVQILAQRRGQLQLNHARHRSLHATHSHSLLHPSDRIGNRDQDEFNISIRRPGMV
jgi:hypothetical protein